MPATRDAQIAPQRSNGNHREDDKRQPKVAGCFVVETAERARYVRRDVRREELVWRWDDEVQQVGRKGLEVLDLARDPLRAEKLDGEGPAGNERECKACRGGRRSQTPAGFSQVQPSMEADYR